MVVKNGNQREHWFAYFTATGSLAHCFALCISWNKPKSIQKKKKSKNRSLCRHNISREFIILIEISVPLDIFDSLFFGFIVSITIKLINNLTTVFNDTWSPDSSSLAKWRIKNSFRFQWRMNTPRNSAAHQKALTD